MSNDALHSHAQRGDTAQGTPDVMGTRRLILRKPRVDDAYLIFSAYAKDQEVTRYLTWKPHSSVEETLEFVHRAIDAWDKEEAYTWIITLRESSEVIGSIDLRVESNANLGYVLAKPYWNLGYMTEAVRAVVAWAIEQDSVDRVWAVCDVENLASARVLEKAGLLREGILHHWIVLPNRSIEPRDCYCYARPK